MYHYSWDVCVSENVSQEIIFTQDNKLVNNKSKSRLREYTS